VAVVATLSKGYDLDYIWRRVDRGPDKDAASYYIQASESGGEPPGRWWGPAAKALGLEHGQTIERKPYDLLFGERKAPDGTPLGRPPGSGRKAADLYARLLAAEPHATAERRRELRIQAARQARQSPLFFDLTISLSKSISIFHASLGENARLARQAGNAEGDQYWSGLVGEVDEMIWQAVHAGFGYFQREAGYTRTGSHHTRIHGRETGQWQEADLAVAQWLQHTSRDGDMQLHVHSQIAHTARTLTDGKWRAPDSLGYNEHVGAVSAIVSQHLEEALTARFGLEWTARDDGHGFEIKGISGQMMRLFSSRRESITADVRARAARFEQRYGREPSQRELAHLAQASNFATRTAKHGTLDIPQAHADWADKLANTLGVSLASVAPSVWHGRGGRGDAHARGAGSQGPLLTELELARAAQKAVELAQQAKPAWTRADVIKYLGRMLPRTGADLTQLEDALADRAGATHAQRAQSELREDQAAAAWLVVRRALGADPRTGHRRWTDRTFLYSNYGDSELGYAVTDHVAQGRPVHTGLAVITGTEDRQHAYVALSRGTDANLAYVFIVSPKRADPAPGPRPAPELARYDRGAAGQGNQPGPAATTGEALAVLAGVLDRDGQQRSATQTRNQALADADHLAILHAIWVAETTPARHLGYQDLLRSVLSPSYRTEPGHQTKWLWRSLRAAELAGLDPARALADAIGERDLVGARDLAAVIDARLRYRFGSLVPLPPGLWSAQIPEMADPERRAYVTEIAALMDARKDRIGEHAADHAPPWAITALGPVPADPLDRLDWQRRAASIGAWRELSGYDHPADPIGPEPVAASPDMRAAWYEGFAALAPSNDGPDVRAMPDGLLLHLRDTYPIETAWAPDTSAMNSARSAPLRGMLV